MLTEELYVVTSSNQFDGLMQCLAYWNKIKGAERWGPEWSLQALAAAQRVQLSLSAFADNIYSLVQPHAESFKQVVTPLPLFVCVYSAQRAAWVP